MLDHFDIFERRPDGSPNWVLSVATLNEAKKRVKKLAASNGHFNYFVFDFLTGKDVFVWPPIKETKRRRKSTSVLS